MKKDEKRKHPRGASAGRDVVRDWQPLFARLQDVIDWALDIKTTEGGFVVVVEIERSAGREEVARLRTGRLGLDLFEAFIAAFPGCTLTLLNGRHRLRLHRPSDTKNR